MKKVWTDFLERPVWRKICDILLVLFALAGAAIIGAWGLYQLGVTNDGGGRDVNYRSLMSVSELKALETAKHTQEQIDAEWALQYGRLAALARYYPVNARLILKAAQHSNDPQMVNRMIAAAQIYMEENEQLDQLSDRIHNELSKVSQRQTGNVIPWMDGPEWHALKEAITRDSALINEAGRLTGVEPRLIVGCLVGEQIRLFNSKREMFKKYLGPVKVLSVESQFSYGVNGIKENTAIEVENHLKDPSSEFYMGKAYEHLLDFESEDQITERYNRLVDYRNHLYSYIYTGCILHQTMLQWRRAGYDISDRPEILITLFNVGFKKSQPKANPAPGGATIEVRDREYTFGGLGFDFYYSGEMGDLFPFWQRRFVNANRPLTIEDVQRIQDGVSDCNRPTYGHEYLRDTSTSTQPEKDPFGINPDEVKPMEHRAF
jgi:hypothetical protein